MLIQLAYLDKRKDTIKLLRTFIESNPQVQAQILARGILFENLDGSVVSLFERQVSQNYRSYAVTGNSLRLLAPYGDVNDLLKIFGSVMRAEGG